MPLSATITGHDDEDLAINLIDAFEQPAQDSPHGPYLSILPPLEDPSSFCTLPYRWSDSQLENAERLLARDQTALAAIGKARADMAGLGDRMQWARANIASRSAYLDSGQIAMVPMLDMINHSPTAEGTSCELSGDGSALVLSTSDAWLQVRQRSQPLYMPLPPSLSQTR